MSRLVPVWLCASVALIALTGSLTVRPAPVLAASGTVSQETQLHASPDPAAPVIALLAEGTSVSIDGPPVDGFYPVTAGGHSGWVRGETMQLEKDLAAPDDAEEMAIASPVDETDETVPVEAPAELDPAPDPAMSTTVEVAPDPAAETSAATETSPRAADPDLGEETAPAGEPVPVEGVIPENEPVPVDAGAAAAAPAIVGDAAAEPTPLEGAGPVEVATIPVAEDSPVGPATVAVDAPILAGPGPEYGFIATAPAGSMVEQTGHMIDGYATVQYAEVTGWVALQHLGAPSTYVVETTPEETAAPIEPLPADAPPVETSLTKTAPIEAAPGDATPAEVVPVAPS